MLVIGLCLVGGVTVAVFVKSLPAKGATICGFLLAGLWYVQARHRFIGQVDSESSEQPAVELEREDGDSNRDGDLKLAGTWRERALKRFPVERQEKWRPLLAKLEKRTSATRASLAKWNRRFQPAFGSVLGDLITIAVFLFLLTFAWEFLKNEVLGSPRLSFSPTNLAYDIKVQSVHRTSSGSDQGLVCTTVLFSNGDSALRPDQIADIQAVGNVLRACPGSRVVVEGFASSRPFHRDSDTNNVRLAKKRADAVVEVLKSAYPRREDASKEIDNVTKDTFREIHGSAAIRDTSAENAQRLLLEALNRRVNVRLLLAGGCTENPGR